MGKVGIIGVGQSSFVRGYPGSIRELAFEGERFYDLIRVAKRRNDPSYLAKAVSSKFPPGRRDVIYSLLMDENNWYINYFDEE